MSGMRDAVLTIAAVLAAACSDALEQDTTVGQVVVVGDSTVTNVSLISATRFTSTAVPAGRALAAPVRMTARDSFVLFAVGAGDSVAILRLLGGGGGATAYIPLGSGAGARGAIGVQSPGLGWVPLTGVNRVMQIDWFARDTVGSLPVSAQPTAAVVVGSALYVLSANTVNDSPTGASFLTRFGLTSLGPPLLIPLSGRNAQGIVMGGDGLLYIVARGNAGVANSRLSIVDPISPMEVAVLNGLGELPGPAVYHPSGRLLVSSQTEGILEVSTLTRRIVRGPGNGVRPGGEGVSALAVDQRGRVYAVSAVCAGGSGTIRILSPPPEYRELKTVAMSGCPRAVAVAYTPAVP